MDGGKLTELMDQIADDAVKDDNHIRPDMTGRSVYIDIDNATVVGGTEGFDNVQNDGKRLILPMEYVGKLLNGEFGAFICEVFRPAFFLFACKLEHTLFSPEYQEQNAQYNLFAYDWSEGGFPVGIVVFPATMLDLAEHVAESCGLRVIRESTLFCISASGVSPFPLRGRRVAKLEDKPNSPIYDNKIEYDAKNILQNATLNEMIQAADAAALKFIDRAAAHKYK